MVQIKNSVELECSNCDKIIVRRPSEIKKNKNYNYCCPKCLYEHKRKLPRKRKDCLICNQPVHSKGTKIKYCSQKCYGKSNEGKTLSKSHRKILSDLKKKNQFGKNNPSWKGGITPEINKIRTSSEMHAWKRKVLIRDDFKCRNLNCKHNSHKLNVHHILEFAKYPEFRFEVWNGITLCLDCHKEIHKKPENRTFKIKFVSGKVRITERSMLLIEKHGISY